MTTTSTGSGTNVHEIAAGTCRINTPVPPSMIPGGFSFNQYLLAGDEALLFHTGPRKMFPLVAEAVASVLSAESLRYIAFSHFEAFRQKMDYFSRGNNAPALLESLALTEPATLACMRGSVWQGDGAALLRTLSGRLSGA